MKKYFPASLVYVYPSANSKDGGADNSEKNLTTITDKFTISNFVVRNKDVPIEEDMSLALTVNADGNLVINHGACSIDGYYLKIEDTVLDVNDCVADAEEHQWNIYETVYNLYIQLYKDGSGLLRGDSGVNQLNQQDLCYGVAYKFVRTIDTDTDINPKLFLGSVGFTATSDSIIFDASSIVLASNRFAFIDSDAIKGKDNRTLQEELDYRFRKLSELNYWNNTQDALDPTKTSNALFKVDTTGIYYRLSPTATLTSLLDQIIHAEAGGTTDAGTLGIQTTTNNGISDELALADHDHDNRYILNSALTNYNDMQTISYLRTGKIESVGRIAVGSISAGGSFTGYVSLDPEGTIYASEMIRSYDGSFNGSLSVGHQFELGKLTDNSTAQFSYRAESNSGHGLINMSCALVAHSDDSNYPATITADKVYGAVWNDYADALKKNKDEVMEPGDIISKDLNGDYTLGTEDNPKLVVGVFSDTYGHLLGGDPDKSMEENLKEYIPVAVSGNVKVKVTGTARAGDLIKASDIPGVGIVSHDYIPGTIVGKLLEDKLTEEVSRVLMQVMLI